MAFELGMLLIFKRVLLLNRQWLDDFLVQTQTHTHTRCYIQNTIVQIAIFFTMNLKKNSNIYFIFIQWKKRDKNVHKRHI